MGPTITETRPNHDWSAFRDKLDATIQAAEEARDVEAWSRAVRVRVHRGSPEDVPQRFSVHPDFYGLLLDHVRTFAGLGGDLTIIAGYLYIMRIPIVFTGV